MPGAGCGEATRAFRRRRCHKYAPPPPSRTFTAGSPTPSERKTRSVVIIIGREPGGGPRGSYAARARSPIIGLIAAGPEGRARGANVRRKGRGGGN